MKIKIGILAVIMLLFSLGFGQDVSGELEKAERIAQIAHEMRSQLMLVRDGVSEIQLTDSQKAELMKGYVEYSNEIARLIGGIEVVAVSGEGVPPSVHADLDDAIGVANVLVAKHYYKTDHRKILAFLMSIRSAL